MSSPFKTPWHFDNFKVDNEGEYVKIVGQFQGDWDDDVRNARLLGLSTKKYNKQSYEHAANKPSANHEMEDAENLYGQPDAPIFEKMDITDYPGKLPAFEKIIDSVKIDTTKSFTFKFHDQLPNQQLMWHIDNLPGNPRKERVIDNPDFKYQDPNMVRFLIMLNDWEPGQVVQFGSIVYTQWKKGTAITWEWSTLPHITWNGSWERRPALQLTGYATEATWNLITKGNKDSIYKI
jgi:hypothetical protein